MPAATSPQSATTSPGPEAPAPISTPITTHVAVLDRDPLDALARRGWSLGELAFGMSATTTASLTKLAGYRSISDVVRQDIRDTARAQPAARVTSVQGTRLFDERWLDSEEMSFQLTGVINRLDRRAFYDGTCGEVRFLYRLAYETSQAGASMEGRLPMTANVVFLVDGAGGCESVARAWQAPHGLAGDGLVEWLTTKGALSPAMRARWSLKSVETNVQTIRLQSTVHTTLGGHIEYGMRVFHPVGGGLGVFAPAPMENMPDVTRLETDAALRDELLAHLRDPTVLASIDRGTLRLPERFLASHAISVAPRALTRTSNRPFSRLFDDEDFADLDLEGRPTIRSPKALLRRLDGASCTGCHQSRSIAGFHLVGHDPDDAPAWSSLLRGASSHLTADLERRRAYVAAVAEGREPDEHRPVPERQGVGTGVGAPCGLGDPGLSDWACDEGLRCTKLEDDDVGVCLAESSLGAPCEFGEPVPQRLPHRESVRAMRRDPCDAGQHCNPNISGFPLGFCTTSCTAAEAEGGACSDFLDIDTFQACLRYGQTEEVCAKSAVLPVGVPACDASTPCRQDYVCARTATPGVGACVPPYFVFALRADGYPLKK